MLFSETGVYLQQLLTNLDNYYQYAHVINFVVMPNHFHLLVFIDCDHAPSNTRTPMKETELYRNLNTSEFHKKIQMCSGNVSKLMRNIKSLTTSFAHRHGITFKWQRSFHDNIVRTPEAQEKIALYIMTNVMRWDDDCFNE